MASGRGSVQMTEAEIEDFLAANMKVQVATIGPDGAPHLTTLFYVVEDGRLAFWTYGASQKVVNLRRDPRITCLVEDGEDYFELRGVSIQGTARLIEEYDDIRALGAKVARADGRGRGPRRLRRRDRREAGPQARRHRGRTAAGGQLGPRQDGGPSRVRRRVGPSQHDRRNRPRKTTEAS